jgi:excinuclease UvrABC helicase subunit UvrB
MIDESHQTIPQVSGMYGGDRSRKVVWLIMVSFAECNG